jgi:putative hemolysin
MVEALIILVCLFLNAILAAYEMAFVAVSKPELKGLAKLGSKDASRLLLLRTHPERTLSVIQLGLTFSSAVAAAVGGMGAVNNLEPYFMSHLGLSHGLAKALGIILVVIPLTYLSVVLGELVPKTLALRHPTRIVMWGAKALFWADRAFSPLIFALEWSTKLILKNVFHRAKTDMNLPEVSIEIGELSPVHQKFMLNMADIERKKIKDILVPWDQVNFVQKTDSMAEVSQMVVSSAHTRLPVLENNRIVGILHTKEFIALKESGAMAWQSIIRQVLKVQSTDSALGVLRLMQEKRNHMTVVFSPFGERLGIVTLEDILEEIIGDIFDEDDDGIVRRVFSSRTRNRMISSR